MKNQEIWLLCKEPNCGLLVSARLAIIDVDVEQVNDCNRDDHPSI